MPKVLIADQLSPAAVAIFKDRGVEADTKTGLSKDELLKIIGEYDGLAVRSATKVNADFIFAWPRTTFCIVVAAIIGMLLTV